VTLVVLHSALPGFAASLNLRLALDRWRKASATEQL
jgi:hypothetical protein